MSHKFDPKKLFKLDNPERRKLLPPEDVIMKMGISKGQVVVDIGCGIGYFSLPLAKIVGEKGLVYGLDILAEMLDEARIRYTDSEVKNINNLEFLQSKENNLPLQDQIADVVIMVNVFHELEEPGKLLKEIKRVLKTGGKLCVVEWKKEMMEVGPPIEHRKSKNEIINTLEVSDYNFIESIELPPAHTLISVSSL